MPIHRLSRGRSPLVLLAVLTGLLALVSCGEKSLYPSPVVQATEVIVRLPIVTPWPTATPAPATPRPTATPAPTPTPLIHTIAAGDNLWDIAREHYGDAREWRKIMDANAVSSVRGLQIGQKLKLPK